MHDGFSKIDPGAAGRVAQSVARIDALATLMDAAFVIPGTNIKMGLDGLIGLVPVAGDLIASVISSYIIWEARQLGAPRWLLMRMLVNVAIDTAVGSVPVVGDAFDVMFRANLKNVALLKRYLAQQGRLHAGPIIDVTPH
jgi:Domain of unknown function (DUF4112)